MKKSFQWASNFNTQLAKAIPNIAIPRYLQEFAPLIVLKSNTNDNKLQKSVDGMIESLKGLYGKYFNISPSAYPTTYGHRTSVVAYPQERDISSDANVSIAELFELVSEKKLLDKLITFQIRDFVAKADKDLQRDDLSQKSLYVPTILANTPLSLLCCLKEKYGDGGKDIVGRVLEKSRNPEELAFICYILLQKNIMETLIQGGNLYGYIDCIIEQYIQEKVAPEHIQEIYQKNRKKQKLEDRIQTLADDVSIKMTQEILQEAVRQGETSTSQTAGLQEELDFLGINIAEAEWLSANKNLLANMRGVGLKQLFEKKDIDQTQLNEILKKIDAIKDRETVLGKIQQCVEAGSEKSVIEGTILETLQNSIDAVRGYVKKLNATKTLKTDRGDGYSMSELAEIHFNLELQEADEEGKNHLVYSIHDQAGFPTLSTLLIDFLLPDFSSKSPEKGNIGDMGNGSFKIYQDADTVSLLTRLTSDSSKFYLLVIKPERDEETNLVKDLKFVIKDVSRAKLEDMHIHEKFDFWGTLIKVVFRKAEKIKNNINVFAIKDFLNNCVGTVSAYVDEKKENPFVCVQKEDVPINPEIKEQDVVFEYTFEMLKKSLISEELNTFKDAYQKRFNRDITGNPILFRVIKRKNDLLQSYVTTGGIPFRPLGAVARGMGFLPSNFIQRINHGFIIDLDTSTYSPVQSRAQLAMIDPIKKALKIALIEAYYIIGLQKGCEETKNAGKEKRQSSFLAHNFTHINSPVSEINQLLLGVSGDAELKKKLNEWYSGTSEDYFLSESLFFDYYHPISSPSKKSFFDYIQKEIVDLFGLLNIEKQKCQKESDEALKKWELDYAEKIKATTENHDPVTVDALKKASDEKINALTNSFEQKKKDIFEKWQKECMSNDASSINAIENKEYGLFRDIVTKWAFNKRISVQINFNAWTSQNCLKTKEALKKEKENTEKANHMKNFFTLADYKEIDGWAFLGKDIKNLFQIFCDLVITENTKKVMVNFYYDQDDDCAGYFSKNDGAVWLNLRFFDITDLSRYIFSILCNRKGIPFEDIPLATIEDIFSDRVYNDYFAPNKLGNATVLNHELEHVRRQDARANPRNHGSHDAGTDAYGNTKQSFEVCANSFIFKAKEAGLLSQWISKFATESNLFKVDNFDFLVQHMYKGSTGFEGLHEFETLNKKMLLEKLGLLDK